MINPGFFIVEIVQKHSFKDKKQHFYYFFQLML